MSNQRKGHYKEILSKGIDEIKQAGTYKNERVIVTQQSTNIKLVNNERELLNFCANNYLGLANNSELIAASKDTLDKYGYGYASVRFICGTADIHKQLERRIADFYGKDDCILYSSCFDANGGLFECLLTPEDAIISDSLNHASIIDGIRLCKAQRYRYPHNDLNELEKFLVESQKCRLRMIATDGVFSMDGDLAKLPQICDLADKYNAIVFVDDSHATGFLGEKGKGTIELLNCMDRVDIINSTLGKALGGASGGYTCASREIVELLRQKSRPYLFSNTLSPSIVGASLKLFDILESNNYSTILRNNTHLFRDLMEKSGFTLKGDYDIPIIPIMIFDGAKAAVFADLMLSKGIYVIAFSYPVVPKGEARIRVQLSAIHTVEQINRCVDAFTEIGKELGII